MGGTVAKTFAADTLIENFSEKPAPLLISTTWSPLTSCFVPVSSTKPSCWSPISKATVTGDHDVTATR